MPKKNFKKKYNKKKGIHDYSFSTIEIGQTIKCIAKSELKNSYVNQTIRRFWAKNLLKQNKKLCDYIMEKYNKQKKYVYTT